MIMIIVNDHDYRQCHQTLSEIVFLEISAILELVNIALK